MSLLIEICDFTRPNGRENIESKAQNDTSALNVTCNLLKKKMNV